MKAVARIGLDIAKNTFQVHGVNAHGAVVMRKQLSRGEVLRFFANVPACVVGIEACAGSHYWARELKGLGHDARLMAGQFVAPYRKSGKNDANDAEAICEAGWGSNMRFGSIKKEKGRTGLYGPRAPQWLGSQGTA